MALWRLFKNSIRFAFRARKRWFTFMIIFALLSAFVTLLVSEFNNFATADLMNHKGFYSLAVENSTTLEQGEALKAQLEALEGVETVALFPYFDFGSYMRVFGVDPEHKWMFSRAKPTTLTSGKYLSHDGEVMASSNSSLKADFGETAIDVVVTIRKGEKITFINNTGSAPVMKTLEVVGDIDDDIKADGKLKIFVTMNDFEEIHDYYGADTTIYCYSIALIVQGDLFKPFDNTIEQNMQALRTPGSSFLTTVGNNTYGDWQAPIHSVPSETQKERARATLAFVVGVIGGFVLTILYNFLIVWFRKREIAILRAMGYKHTEIRISLLGEVLTISFFGYLTGVLGILIYYWFQGMTFMNETMSLMTLLISFCLVVIISIPGLLVASFSFNKVSPIMLFKGR